MLGGLFIILASTLWALDTIIRYPLLGSVSAERIVFTEHLFLVLIFLPYFWNHFKSFFNLKISTLFYFFVIGVCGSAIATLTFTKAFMLINPSLVILLQKLQPIIAIGLASVVLKETIKKEFMVWAIVCLIGSVLISSPDIFPNLKNFDFKLVLAENSLKGYFYTLIAVVSWGASTVFGKKLVSSGLDEKAVMGGRFLFGLIFMSLYLFSNPHLAKFDLNIVTWGKILGMVLMAGLFGMYFYYRGLSLISAKLCALLEMFFPLAAVAINWVFLGRALDPVQIVGGALLVLGSTLIQLRHL
jgi:drug/metabolite transporter (DMT)-like permease